MNPDTQQLLEQIGQRYHKYRRCAPGVNIYQPLLQYLVFQAQLLRNDRTRQHLHSRIKTLPDRLLLRQNKLSFENYPLFHNDEK